MSCAGFKKHQRTAKNGFVHYVTTFIKNACSIQYITGQYFHDENLCDQFSFTIVKFEFKVIFSLILPTLALN